ncbi:DUF86 domain-containing protein [bacterium]|nr:DUF86 domain-containing protein [bacterium]
MKPEKSYLLDMLLSARKGIEFISNATEKTFLADEILQNAVIRIIIVTGEAATRISDESKTKYSQIPWREIIGMRNILVHDYAKINLSQIWFTITNEIPKLIEHLESIVSIEDL